MSKNINTAPKYCPNAVASKKGWHDPSTGELLVSNKSLDLELISKTNNVIRTSLAPTMEEQNDALIAEMFPEEIEIGQDVVETIQAEISVNDDVSADVETERKVFSVDVGDMEINKEIIDGVIAKAKMVEQLHDEAGNSEMVFDMEPVKPTVDEEVEDIIDFEEMTNAELLKYGKKIGAKVAKRDNKTTLIEKIKEIK